LTLLITEKSDVTDSLDLYQLIQTILGTAQLRDSLSVLENKKMPTVGVEPEIDF
jgi:hypothetical protein